MKRRWFIIVLLSMAISGLLSTGCGKSAPKKRAGQDFLPANAVVFYAPMNEVWDTLVKTLRYDFLFSLAIVNRRGGFLTTEILRDYEPELQMKSRVSASLKSDGDGIVVSLYNERQIKTNKGWQTLPTDYSLERRILRRLRQRLQP